MISKFEDLPVWQDSRVLTRQIYELTRSTVFDKDYRLKGQLRGSSLSIMSNIAEGYEYESTKQFIWYLNIAKGSSGELRSQLYVAMDAKYIDDAKMNELKDQATSISKQCAGLIKYLKGYDQNNNVVKEFDDVNFSEIINEFHKD
jgi:four helix bundle protein